MPQLNLAMLRQQKGVSLRSIADSTKISHRFLEAIEAEEFDKLPGGIYTTSYIRQYAAAVSYDEFELLQFYRVNTGLVPASDAEQDPHRDHARKPIPAEA
jgi:cytoskeletal protein RodZ